MRPAAFVSLAALLLVGVVSAETAALESVPAVADALASANVALKSDDAA